MPKYYRYLVDRYDIEVLYPERPRGLLYSLAWSVWTGLRRWSDIKGVRLRRADVTWPN